MEYEFLVFERVGIPLSYFVLRTGGNQAIKCNSPRFVKDGITEQRCIAYLLPICRGSLQCSSIFLDSLWHCELHGHKNLSAKLKILLVW